MGVMDLFGYGFAWVGLVCIAGLITIFIVFAIIAGFALLIIFLTDRSPKENKVDPGRKFFKEQENMQREELSKNAGPCPNCGGDMRVDKEMQGVYCKKCGR